MTAQSRLLVFSLVASIVYVLAYNFGWQLFAYYPLLKEVHWAAGLSKSAGPAMMYYGWMATAALAGLAAALIVPAKWAARLWPGLAWLVPALLVAFTLIYERRWFV